MSRSRTVAHCYFLLLQGDDKLEKITGVLHVEPIARSDKRKESGASNSVGNARPSEMKKSTNAALKYMMNDCYRVYV